MDGRMRLRRGLCALPEFPVFRERMWAATVRYTATKYLDEVRGHGARSLGGFGQYLWGTRLLNLLCNLTMGSQSSSPPPVVPREPSHPIECLQIIELPGCVVCGRPTPLYCGGCPASPAYCSSDHYMEVIYCPLILH